jgi:hypothetical protein
MQHAACNTMRRNMQHTTRKRLDNDAACEGESGVAGTHRWPSAMRCIPSASMKVDLPAPGGPATLHAARMHAGPATSGTCARPEMPMRYEIGTASALTSSSRSSCTWNAHQQGERLSNEINDWCTPCAGKRPGHGARRGMADLSLVRRASAARFDGTARGTCPRTVEACRHECSACVNGVVRCRSDRSATIRRG